MRAPEGKGPVPIGQLTETFLSFSVGEARLINLFRGELCFYFNGLLWKLDHNAEPLT